MPEAIAILDSHRIMAISTVRPDGWPQNTIVGYANEALTLYFLIFRSSQKFANIQLNDRIAIAVGHEPAQLGEASAVYAGAHAAEVTDPDQRKAAWRLLEQRHPNLGGYVIPKRSEVAMMKAELKFVSVVDFTKGLGHTEPFSITAGDDTGSQGSTKAE